MSHKKKERLSSFVFAFVILWGKGDMVEKEMQICTERTDSFSYNKSFLPPSLFYLRNPKNLGWGLYASPVELQFCPRIL